MTKQEIIDKFFNLLSEELEEIYPKGERLELKDGTKHSPRSRALVFNAKAKLILMKLLDGYEL
jgi:hypothetical protein